MDAELISIGDEIVSGCTIDTNSAYIAPRLAELDDDITKRAIVKVFKRNLVFHEEILDDIKRRFEARGFKMPSINQNQALLPQGATYLANKTGSAVGIVIAEEGKIFVSLPGVPREMKIMVDEELIPYLKERIKTGTTKIVNLRTTGIIESALAEKLSSLNIPESIRLAYLPSYSGVDLRIVSNGLENETVIKSVEQLAGKIRDAVGKYIYGEGNVTLEEAIGRLLKEKNETVATAESCTAGLLAGKITNVPGSSAYFEQGMITYSNQAKIDLLGVAEETLDKFGAVSQETAEAMASGIREKATADYGVSITGIAGPDGGTEEKPVGTVFVAVASGDGIVSRKFLMAQDREINRNRSVYAALEMLRRVILRIE
jgi:nicotinamide-nucleotide amidase